MAKRNPATSPSETPEVLSDSERTVSNRHTVGAIFKRDLSEPRTLARHKRLIVETVERLVLLKPASADD